MAKENVFDGRSISMVSDLSIDEQMYLYEKTRELKQAAMNKEDLSRFKINDPEMGVYLFFMESSTRTKESFRNAGKFHNIKLNDFNAVSSSFSKHESITDTIKMLVGYSTRSMFIIRSKLEGVCTWLHYAIGEYTKKLGLKHPVFINAGDGKHEHPTQEFLDEFSFLEHLNWNRDHIHIALVGDLFHGRTIHSKAEGLRVFHNVTVDLIAPEELSMPEYWIDKMASHEFRIRVFESIEEYLSQPQIASIWYFTRLQLERMGEEVLKKADFLRNSVTFQKRFIDRVPKDTKFYHPLPRHRDYPTIPAFLDFTSLNGWDEQSVNGYYTRIIEIGMLGAKLGSDFKGKGLKQEEYTDDFIKEGKIHDSPVQEYKVGIKPVQNGIVIDHIGRGETVEIIWDHINKIRRILQLNRVSSHGVFRSEHNGNYKGLISIPDIDDFDEKQIKMLGAIAPGCTLNKIHKHTVYKKLRLKMPPRIYNFEEISCKNESCVSHSSNSEQVTPEFLRSEASTFICRYCEKEHTFQEIWQDD